MNRVVDEDVANILSEDLPWDRMSGKTVLVTGASGMIGQYVTRTFVTLGSRLEKPVRVVALVRGEAGATRLLRSIDDHAAIKILVQDAGEPYGVDQQIDFIVHAASPANPRAFRSDPVGVIKANVLGTYQALETARRQGAVMCLISTLEVYGDPRDASDRGDATITEKSFGRLDSLDLRSAYPESKRLAENLCVAYAAQHQVAHRIARVSVTYGPGMSLDDPRVQAFFFRQALAGKDIVLTSDGSMRRTYTYISDVVSALCFLLLRDTPGAFNIANESAVVSLKELAETVLTLAGSDRMRSVRTESALQPELWSRHSGSIFLDCSAMRELGWRARVSLREGVTRTLAHHRAATARPA
jgi:UDP-glucuronate decarboxylase